MPILRLVEVTDEQCGALDHALNTTKRLRDWRRLQAVQLLALGREASEVAEALGCSVSSVYYWADDWRSGGLAALTARPHGGGAPTAARRGRRRGGRAAAGGRSAGLRRGGHRLDGSAAADGVGGAWGGAE